MNEISKFEEDDINSEDFCLRKDEIDRYLKALASVFFELFSWHSCAITPADHYFLIKIYLSLVQISFKNRESDQILTYFVMPTLKSEFCEGDRSLNQTNGI